MSSINAWGWEVNFKDAHEVPITVWKMLRAGARRMEESKQNKEGMPDCRLNRLVQSRKMLQKISKMWLQGFWILLRTWLTHWCQQLFRIDMICFKITTRWLLYSNDIIMKSPFHINFSLRILSCIYNLKINTRYLLLHSTCRSLIRTTKLNTIKAVFSINLHFRSVVQLPFVCFLVILTCEEAQRRQLLFRCDIWMFLYKHRKVLFAVLVISVQTLITVSPYISRWLIHSVQISLQLALLAITDV